MLTLWGEVGGNLAHTIFTTWPKITSPKITQIDIMCLLRGYTENTTSLPWHSHPKGKTPNLIMREPQKNPHVGQFTKMSYALQIRQSHDTQRQNDELFQIKGAQQMDITHDLGFSFPIKGIIGTIDQSEIRFAGWIMVVYEWSFPNFDNCTVIM